MYANQIMFNIGPGKRAIADKLAYQFAPLIEDRSGFKELTFLADDVTGEYGVLVVYETKEDADGTFQALSPKLAEALKDIAGKPPVRRLFEVVETNPV
jgi:heme-degrading monooxygenase HmoA